MIFTGHVLYVKYFKYFILDLTPKGWYPDSHSPNKEKTQRGQVACPRPCRIRSRAEVEAGELGEGTHPPGLFSHLSLTFEKTVPPPCTSLSPFETDGMVTFSAHGGRNEFLSAGTLKLLK